MNNHLISTFAHSFVAQSEKLMIDMPQGEAYTYGDVYQLSGQIAQALENASVTKGDRVAVQVDKCPEAIMLYIACVRIGAVYLPLNTDYTMSELNYFISDAEPAVFICRPDKVEMAERLAKLCQAQVLTLGASQGSLLEAAKQLTSISENVACDENDLAAILYTSGTTGCSKGAMLTHGNLASNATALMQYWHFSDADHLIHALPIFHIHGLFAACNVLMCCGCSMSFLNKFNVDAILDLIPVSTCLMGVPTFYTRLLRSERLTADCVKNMRLFISGSAPLKAEVHKAFYRRTNHKILERYGMTETGMNTSNPYDEERIAGTVGFPLPGVQLRIMGRDTGKPLAKNAIGQIQLKGNNVFKGYWRMPEKTREAFTDDGYFITGDLGKIDDKGYLHMMGRDKELIISGGYNVYPKEIESLIDEINGVIESAIVGIPHPDFGEGVTAIIVPKGNPVLCEQSIIDTLRGKLARYKLPKRVLFVDALPRNVMGKVQKNSMREQYATIYQETEPAHCGLLSEKFGGAL